MRKPAIDLTKRGVAPRCAAAPDLIPDVADLPHRASGIVCIDESVTRLGLRAGSRNAAKQPNCSRFRDDGLHVIAPRSIASSHYQMEENGAAQTVMCGEILNRKCFGRPAIPQRGFTLMELMMALAVFCLLMSVAVPTYRGIVKKQTVQQAVRDLVSIAAALEKYRTLHFALPDSLDELSGVPSTDPWGFQYRFLNFQSDIKGIKGKIRKDHNLHPLNTEFDLYSVGPDGRSVPPLTGKPSRDDVIWARDGSFVGLASDY